MKHLKKLTALFLAAALALLCRLGLRLLLLCLGNLASHGVLLFITLGCSPQ